MGEARRPHGTAVLRGAARGGVAAMAMSGMRQISTAIGLVDRTPPETVLRNTAPGLFRRIPADRRQALVEVIHWAFGAAGGVVFGLLPRRVRRRRFTGPAYGFAFWALFEAGIAPLLGIDQRRHRAREHLALLADHLLYGVAVAASGQPYAD